MDSLKILVKNAKNASTLVYIVLLKMYVPNVLKMTILDLFQIVNVMKDILIKINHVNVIKNPEFIF